jgi:Uma2 family endonuclease
MGSLYVSTQPHWYHQVLCARLVQFLGEWTYGSGSGQAAVAPGLIFAEDDAVVPEVVWASQERLARILEGGKLYAAPELVIEVLSPGKKNIARDRETKLKLYARRDADEYWIADWPRHAIEIYRRDSRPRRHADDTAPARLRRRHRSSLRGLSVRRGRGGECRIIRCMSVAGG